MTKDELYKLKDELELQLNDIKKQIKELSETDRQSKPFKIVIHYKDEDKTRYSTEMQYILSNISLSAHSFDFYYNNNLFYSYVKKKQRLENVMRNEVRKAYKRFMKGVNND